MFVLQLLLKSNIVCRFLSKGQKSISPKVIPEEQFDPKGLTTVTFITVNTPCLLLSCLTQSLAALMCDLYLSNPCSTLKPHL